MLRKLLSLAAFVIFAYSCSPTAEALPLRMDTAYSPGTDMQLVRRHWRLRRYRQSQQTGIPIFMIPGIYWGPAWWDPAYTKQCWKKPRCRDCGDYWFYVC